MKMRVEKIYQGQNFKLILENTLWAFTSICQVGIKNTYVHMLQ